MTCFTVKLFLWMNEGCWPTGCTRMSYRGRYTVFIQHAPLNSSWTEAWRKEHVVRSQCPLWRHSARLALPVEHGEGSHVFLQKPLETAGILAIDLTFMPFLDFFTVNNALITYFGFGYWCIAVLHYMCSLRQSAILQNRKLNTYINIVYFHIFWGVY